MKHTLHKVIILAGYFCFGSLSTGLAYRFDPDGANVLVQNAETARHMVNILLQHYHDHPGELEGVAGAYANAFIECLNEFGGLEVLTWQLPGCQGGIRSYVKNGIKDGRDHQKNWDMLYHAFFAGFREAFIDVRPILADYLNELAQMQVQQAQQIHVFPGQGVEDVGVDEPLPALIDEDGF
jgi:hypothetical protein